MLKVNEDILKALDTRAEDLEYEKVEELKDQEYSVNGDMFRKHLANWDKTDEFPIADLKRYVRFAEWTYKDFDFENELIVQDVLPDWCHDIFFKVKKFRDNKRNELTSTQAVFARMMGYKTETQDEKAFVVYDYAYQKFYKDSQLHKEKQEDGNML